MLHASVDIVKCKCSFCVSEMEKTLGKFRRGPCWCYAMNEIAKAVFRSVRWDQIVSLQHVIKWQLFWRYREDEMKISNVLDSLTQ
jgi:hypothetical protein